MNTWIAIRRTQVEQIKINIGMLLVFVQVSLQKKESADIPSDPAVGNLNFDRSEQRKMPSVIRRYLAAMSVFICLAAL
jgi:hypothetical protein